MNTTTIPRVRQIAPVAGMHDGYSWWAITTERGLATEHAYSAEQALKKYEARPKLCATCRAELHGEWRTWYGADYCDETCLRQGQHDQRITSTDDRDAELRSEYGRTRDPLLRSLEGLR